MEGMLEYSFCGGAHSIIYLEFDLHLFSGSGGVVCCGRGWVVRRGCLHSSTVDDDDDTVNIPLNRK